MAKASKTVYVCQNCGSESAKWLGRCPSCGSWNSLVEELKTKSQATKKSSKAVFQAVSISNVPLVGKLRRPTNIRELDQVLGGGIVSGSIILIGGEPGIGKSTLTLQIADQMSRQSKDNILYVSGEESLEQIKLRAERLAIKSEQIYLLAENLLENILMQIDLLKPSLVIIDSIQTIYSEKLVSSPGSVGQVRECTAEILRAIKSKGEAAPAVIIVGHITKFGAIAGPKTLEHIVDVVLYFEGDKFGQYRILRASKNRFGSTQEIGIFEMAEHGLVGVESPSLLFLSQNQRQEETPRVGSVVIATIEGTRPILLEIQALTAPSYYTYPQRVSTGFDLRRLAMLLCVLERHADFNIGNHDIFVNISGGLKINESGADLGVCVAIASSFRNKPINAKTAVIGEVSLAGEIRAVSQMKNRFNECVKLGIKTIVAPHTNQIDKKDKKFEIFSAGNINQALEILGIK
ncbi:MAG: DNA repair protein RadA [candidate division WOR-3 bacterium]